MGKMKQVQLTVWSDSLEPIERAGGKHRTYKAFLDAEGARIRAQDGRWAEVRSDGGHLVALFVNQTQPIHGTNCVCHGVKLRS